MIDKTKSRNATQLLAILAVAAYVISFALPVIATNAPRGPGGGGLPPTSVSGWGVFLSIGRTIALSGDPVRMTRAYFSWLSYPAFVIGLGMLATGRRRAALGFGLAGLALALGQLLAEPVRGQVALLGPGYYLWAASMALLATSAHFGGRRVGPSHNEV